MKKLIVILFVFAAMVCAGILCIKLYASGSNNGVRTLSRNIETRTLTLGDFDEIETSRVDVVYTIGTPGTATLTAPENIIDEIEIYVKNGELHVGLDKDVCRNVGNLNAKLTVSSTSLSEIYAKVSAKVQVNSDIVTADDFDAVATTSATIDLKNVTCKDFKGRTTTSADIRVDTVMCKDFDCELSTSGSFSVSKAVAEKSEIETTTSATAEVGSGSLGIVKLDSTTGARIKVLAEISGGKAKATTGASIKCDRSNLTEVKTSTGGQIRQR